MKTQTYLLPVICLVILLSGCSSQKRVHKNKLDFDEYMVHFRENAKHPLKGPITEIVTSIHLVEKENEESYYIVGLGIRAQAYFLLPHNAKYKQIARVLKRSEKKGKYIKVLTRYNEQQQSEIIDAFERK